MTKTFSNVLLFLVLGAVFLAAVIVNNLYLKGYNVDLTDDKVYSLSQGSEAIAAELNEPITLHFFFSDSNSTGMTVIRDYADRVESLLREYERLSGGMIKLEIIDPKPFSEAEDRAATFGLTAASTGVAQDTIYFGLAGTNSIDDTVVIGFFDPQKEPFLEYDVSSLIYKLSDPRPVKLAIVTDLQVAGGQNPLNGQVTPPYALYTQLSEFFELSLLSSSDTELPGDADLLMLWHPQNVNEELLKSIDQYMISGGKPLALLDPQFESDPMARMGSVGANTSSLPLLEAYGVDVDTKQVVLDALVGLEVRNNQGGVDRHLGYLGLTREQIDKNDITTGDLDSVNAASMGKLALSENSQLSQVPLLVTSSDTSVMPNLQYSQMQNPADLLNEFLNTNTQRVVAARYSGSAPSYFDQNSSGNVNLVVIADADIAADRFWVQQSSFFGQTVFSPFANNADFIVNILENFGGSENLIGIRSRGTFARPFTKVQEIQVVAEAKFREQEKLLQAQLEQTEQQLADIQTQTTSLTLTSEQQAAIDQLRNSELPSESRCVTFSFS